MQKGIFVAIEGVDGAGKTATLEKFKKLYPTTFLNYQTAYGREPGGTLAGEKIRAVVLHEVIEPLTEAYLFAASRTEYVRKFIQPALQKQQLVITDRYVYSSFAYQGLTKKLGLETVKKINEAALNGVWPDFIFVFDCSFEEAVKRMAARGKHDLLDNATKSKADFETVRNYYHSLVDNKRVFFIKGVSEAESLHNFIEQLTKCLNQHTHS